MKWTSGDFGRMAFVGFKPVAAYALQLERQRDGVWILIAGAPHLTAAATTALRFGGMVRAVKNGEVVALWDDGVLC